MRALRLDDASNTTIPVCIAPWLDRPCVRSASKCSCAGVRPTPGPWHRTEKHGSEGAPTARNNRKYHGIQQYIGHNRAHPHAVGIISCRIHLHEHSLVSRGPTAACAGMNSSFLGHGECRTYFVADQQKFGFRLSSCTSISNSGCEHACVCSSRPYYLSAAPSEHSEPA